MANPENPLRVLSLGGLGRIGGNLLVYETDSDLLVVDCGACFPGPEAPGIDWIVPEIGYLQERRDKLRAYVLTHGHEDHIGALPFILRELPAPMYGSAFTLALVGQRLADQGSLLVDGAHRRAEWLRPLVDNVPVGFGSLTVTPLSVTHSIPGALALALTTPVGNVVHTGDFRFDPTPLDGRVTDVAALTALGQQGVTALLSDSTNALHVGHTWSEEETRRTLAELVTTAPRRVVVTAFASNVYRMRAVLDAARSVGRVVVPVGRSMCQILGIAAQQGLVNTAGDLVRDVSLLSHLAPEQTVVLASGCQAEPQSAFGRISRGEHAEITLGPGDRVVISARRIPGNERDLASAVNRLLAQGVEVFDDRGPRHVHASGHGFADELGEMIRLCRPRYVIPLHGEWRHLRRHAELAEAGGACAVLLRDGVPLDFSGEPGNVTVTRQASVGAGDRFVQHGRQIPDIVLRDRLALSQSGFVVCAIAHDALGQRVGPASISTRGVVWVDENPDLLAAAARAAEEAFDALPQGVTDDARYEEIRLAVRRFFRQEVMQRPMVVPTFIAISEPPPL